MAHESAQKIGVATATIVGMNAMIGAGIFTAPAALSSNVGPAGILAYVFVLISVWFMATSLARIAALTPQEGSFYAYARRFGGHSVGLIAASLYLVGLIIAMGLLAQKAGEYLHPFIPSLSSYSLGLVILVSLVLLNAFGAVLSELGQQALIICTVFPLLATTLLCLTKFDISNLTPFAPYGIRNVFSATKMVIFSFFGYEAAASLFTTVENPQKNVPRALAYSITAVGIIYLLFVTSLIASIPLSYFSDPTILLPDVLKQLFPNSEALIGLVHVAMLSAMLGTVHSMIWSSSSLLTTFVKICTQSRQRPLVLHNTVAIVAIGIAIFGTFTLLKDQSLFFPLTAMGIISANILSIIPLLTMKDEWLSGRNIQTLIGLATAILILYFAVEGIIQALG